MSAEDVLRQHEDEWLEVPGVVGVAIGATGGRPCIQVLISRRTPEISDRIPSQIGGYPVVIKATGELRSRDSR